MSTSYDKMRIEAATKAYKAGKYELAEEHLLKVSDKKLIAGRLKQVRAKLKAQEAPAQDDDFMAAIGGNPAGDIASEPRNELPAMSSDEQDLIEAKRLIRQQRYEEARAILITIDDPAADRLLSKLPVETVIKKRDYDSADEDKSFTNKLVIAFVLLWFMFIPGIIATSIWAGEAKKYPNAPGAQGLILLNRIAFGLLALSVFCMCSYTAIVSVM